MIICFVNLLNCYTIISFRKNTNNIVKDKSRYNQCRRNEKMTSSKKMLALIIVIAMAIVAVTGTLIAVLVAGNQSAESKVHVKYTSSDVNVRVEAKYYIGSTGTDMVDKSNGNATSIELDANKTSGSLDQNVTEVTLDKTNSRIVYEYKFTNLSSSIPATIDQLLNADNTIMIPSDVNNNVDITYMTSTTQLGSNASSTSTTFNKQALPVSSTRYVYVMVAIHDLLADVDFQGDFGWDLAKGTSATVDSTGSGNSIVNVNTSQTGFYNADAVSKIDLMVGVENVEPAVYPMVESKCFTGWYTNSGLTSKANFPMVVTETTKLYPKFETATSGIDYFNAGDMENPDKFVYFVGDVGAETYSGSATNIVIPDVHNGQEVVGFYSAYFKNKTTLKSINLPKSIRNIMNDTFNGCTSLTTVVLQAGLREIGERVFLGCSKLTNVSIPEGVTTLGWSAFSECTSLTSIVIPSTMRSMVRSAFNGCTNLTNITIKGGITDLGDSTFMDCSNLTSIVIPDSVTQMGQYTFNGCSKLSNVTLSKNLTTMVDFNFYGCKALTSIVLPDKLQTIPDNMFGGCTALTNVVIGSGVKKINKNAFKTCTSLSSATFKTIKGWTVTTSSTATTGTPVQISETNTSANATLLKSTYVSQYWNRA